MTYTTKRNVKTILVSLYALCITLSGCFQFFYYSMYDSYFLSLSLFGVAVVYLSSVVYFIFGIKKKHGDMFKISKWFIITGYGMSFVELLAYGITTSMHIQLGLFFYLLAIPFLFISYHFDDTPEPPKDEKMIENAIAIDGKFFLGYSIYGKKLHKVVGIIDTSRGELRLGTYLKQIEKDVIKFEEIEAKSIVDSPINIAKMRLKKDDFSNPSIMNYLIHEYSVFVAGDDLGKYVDEFFSKRRDIPFKEVKLTMKNYTLKIYTTEDFISQFEQMNFHRELDNRNET